jgi:hypothetical protein
MSVEAHGIIDTNSLKKIKIYKYTRNKNSNFTYPEPVTDIIEETSWKGYEIPDTIKDIPTTKKFFLLNDGLNSHVLM